MIQESQQFDARTHALRYCEYNTIQGRLQNVTQHLPPMYAYMYVRIFVCMYVYYMYVYMYVRMYVCMVMYYGWMDFRIQPHCQTQQERQGWLAMQDSYD